MSREPQPFPPDWANAWGDDVYWLWAEFEVKEVRQRMRWIAPGEFWMGSPEDEPMRYVDEGPRHRVRISKGFWLADTACTQALWLALTGEDPSGFMGDLQCPVESVSWDDVQAFLQALGAAELLRPDLPTEAEWEYACRAGTESAFHFGAQITPKQVNYDGDHPYAGGKQGEYRQRTVSVKGLPANRWGLFQMHGNVWEWCKDGLRTYAAKDAVLVDPEGPMAGAEPVDRVLRGGSWFNHARGARSAYRDASRPGRRLHGYGFRLVLRSTSPVR